VNKDTLSRQRFAYANGDTPLNGYTIERGIGVGGFGEVYFAISNAGKEVALKRVQRNLDIELRGVRHCLNLKHTNLITLWDIAQDEFGEGWVVMEYVPGESLRDVIQRHPEGMPIELVQTWFVSICHGVAHLHRHGIVHRDLKPGNIFHDSHQDVIKIGDYGLSKFISGSKRDGQTESVGTFHYMAPEIGKGEYGKEIDIYALGIILCEMCTGRVPFNGESSQEIIMKHVTADPELYGLSGVYRRVVRKALAKDPLRRYPNVESMLEELPFGNDQKPPAALHVATDGQIVDDAQIDLGEIKTSGRVPPIQPVLINEVAPFYIGNDDEEIVLGEVQEVVNAQSVYPMANVKSHALPLDREYSTVAHSKSFFHWLADWWNTSSVSMVFKLAVVLVTGMTMLLNSAFIVPIASLFGFACLIFLGLRVFARWLLVPKTIPQHGPDAVDLRLRECLRLAPWSNRFESLIGSFLAAAGVAIAMALVGMGITNSQNVSGHWSFATWFTVTCIIAAWSLLLVGKRWETRHGDAFLRRGVSLTLGMAVGTVSLLVSKFLLVDWKDYLSVHDPKLAMESILTDANGFPLVIGYVALFGGLFLLVRWWRQTDPLRRTRLSLWGVGASMICAAFLSMLVQFPILWGTMLAMVLSVSIQLAAPWLHPDERMTLRLQRAPSED
jgi:serine/threonine protein kinase